MEIELNNQNNGKKKEQCSKTRTILSAIRWHSLKTEQNQDERRCKKINL
jgi:hypothetical protein